MDTVLLLTSVHERLAGLSRAKQAYQRTFSPDFNSLEILGLNENRMSTALAFLLNPHASHGQGDIFLRAFLKQLQLEWVADSHVTSYVRTEALTDQIEAANRRMDVLVECETFVFAIENKFWAVDQAMQLADYSSQLAKLAATRKTRCLVYLTPHGIEPSATSMHTETLLQEIRENRLRLLSYTDHILAWLAECITLTQSPRVWSFLSELSRFIENKFKGVSDVVSHEIVQASTQSPQSVATALKIAFAADDIKLTLLGELQSRLSSGCDEREWKMLGAFKRDKWTGISIDFGASYPCLFRVAFEKQDFNELLYGLIRRDDRAKGDKRVRDKVSGSLGPSAGTSDKYHGPWDWYRAASRSDSRLQVAPDWEADAEPWVAVADGTLLKNLFLTAQAFKELLDRERITV